MLRGSAAVVCLACTGQSEAPSEISAEAAETSPETAEDQTSEALQEVGAPGWAPVFRGPLGLEAMAPGRLIGPTHVEDPEPIDQVGPCGGQLLANTARAVLVMPEGAVDLPPPSAPRTQASLVETASWRLATVLPQSTIDPASTEVPQPARQRGIALGSVSKVRRHGAPPVYLVSGSRACSAAVAVLSHDMESVLDQTLWTGICDPVAVMPPTDLDGDMAREFAVFNSEFVAMLRLIETPGRVSLEPMAHWSCDTDDGGSSP